MFGFVLILAQIDCWVASLLLLLFRATWLKLTSKPKCFYWATFNYLLIDRLLGVAGSWYWLTAKNIEPPIIIVKAVTVRPNSNLLLPFWRSDTKCLKPWLGHFWFITDEWLLSWLNVLVSLLLSSSNLLFWIFIYLNLAVTKLVWLLKSFLLVRTSTSYSN